MEGCVCMKLNEWKNKLGSLFSKYRKDNNSSSDSEFELSSDDGLSVGSGSDEKTAIICYVITGITGFLFGIGTYWTCCAQYIDTMQVSWFNAIATSFSVILVGFAVFGIGLFIETILLKRISENASDGKGIRQTGIAVGCLLFIATLMGAFFFSVPVPFFMY